ncbi:helix-turn-helix domain-containing protein [[Clostridium] polysaccharolyticum]|uniref:Cro/C1-type HTH DNA-binding domain-containing protein n=1 Tax=[Clostridium] polysaccharolyticum TaxID=29364 RepID=A0A1H9Y9R5_9FIRM|nr:helix-turn-helix domain-containing protein [[Clostridium] polysaccharolyticum]SES65679.1 Cro/C1-type HTH DNA-binding domain-containing protein [[Clostridium] polysaccharolyticum]
MSNRNKDMNSKIIELIKGVIDSKGIKYTYVSNCTDINYQRLMRLFNQNAIISGSELICICKNLPVELDELMDIVEGFSDKQKN